MIWAVDEISRSSAKRSETTSEPSAVVWLSAGFRYWIARLIACGVDPETVKAPAWSSR